MAENANRDANRVTVLLVDSNAGDDATVRLWADPASHRLLTTASITGTVTSSSLKASASTPTRVAISTTSAQLLAANTARVQAVIVNEAAANLYVKYGTTASATSYIYILLPNDSLIVDSYTGRIDGILASGSGTAQINEL